MHKPKFAPVAPINILEALHESNDLGTYHLVLSHDVLANAGGFQKLFGHSNYAYATIIVDNSVIELGTPLDADSIRRAGEVFKDAAKQSEVVIVLPDVLLDCDATIRVTSEALNVWAQYSDKFKFMFVPQGKTELEFAKCAEAFYGVRNISWIGIARNIVPIAGSRQNLTRVFQSIFPHTKQHLLGFSDNIWDDIVTAKYYDVEGIDSAVPLRLSTHKMLMTDKVYPSRSKDWWDNAEYNETVLYNVHKFRSWIGDVVR